MISFLYRFFWPFNGTNTNIFLFFSGDLRSSRDFLRGEEPPHVFCQSWILQVFYVNTFSRSSIRRSPPGLLLGDFLQVFYEKTPSKNSMRRSPKGLLLGDHLQVFIEKTSFKSSLRRHPVILWKTRHSKSRGWSHFYTNSTEWRYFISGRPFFWERSVLCVKGLRAVFSFYRNTFSIGTYVKPVELNENLMKDLWKLFFIVDERMILWP